MLRLETPRLELRDYIAPDWERVHIYAKVPEFSRFELWGPNTVEESKKFVADMVDQAKAPDRYKFDLAICLKNSSLLIGGCGIRRESPSSCIANMGWAINPEFQSQGYATEAARELIAFAFMHLKLKVIYATCDARNEASRKVMEKIGLRSAGVIREERMQKGFLRDTLRFEMTAS